MGFSRRRSFAARLYALLLHLYPAAFRREYGESMLQLFNDQRRAAHGAGGCAMLWLKTLRDLLLSVPAAHANGRCSTSSSKAAAVVWTVVAILGLVFLLNSLVLPSMISRMPRTDEAALATAPVIVAPEQLGPTGEYRTVARVAAAGISTLLAFGALLFALRQPRVLNGLAPFVAGGALSFMALAMNPWIWLPLDRYPVAIVWALGIWPLAASAWAALRIAARRSHPSV